MQRGLATLLAVLMPLGIAEAQQQDGWFTLNTPSGTCNRAEEGPASMIHSLTSLGSRHTVQDEVDSATRQIARVTITINEMKRQVVFYRGVRRCDEELARRLDIQRARRQQVEDRYRITPAPSETSSAPPTRESAGTNTRPPQPSREAQPQQSVTDTLARLRAAQA